MSMFSWDLLLLRCICYGIMGILKVFDMCKIFISKMERYIL